MISLFMYFSIKKIHLLLLCHLSCNCNVMWSVRGNIADDCVLLMNNDEFNVTFNLVLDKIVNILHE